MIPLNTKVKKAVVNGLLYDIINQDEYNNTADKKTLPNNSSIAVEKKLETNEIVDIPIRNINYYSDSSTTPGIYLGNASPFVFTVEPSIENKVNFIPRKTVEINNTDSMKEVLEKEEIITRMSEPWITSPDSISKFNISEDDHPEMICLKEALNNKQIDFDKYAMRFGPNFPNDKRQLGSHTATLKTIIRYCDNLDMEAILILRDKSPSVPNPIGKEIRVSLTDYNNYEE